MTDIQKKLLILLLEESYSHGFCYYPISWIAKQSGLKVEEIYDSNTESGVLWSMAQFGEGYLDHRSGSLAIMMDTLDYLQRELNC